MGSVTDLPPFCIAMDGEGGWCVERRGSIRELLASEDSDLCMVVSAFLSKHTDQAISLRDEWLKRRYG